MFLDASSIIAMLGDEAEGGVFADALSTAKAPVTAVGESELAVALGACDQFGNGRHPGRLNRGDCFAYAAAKRHGAPMLHKDDGFYLTDVSSVLAKR